jgi:hypothetical protein
MEHLLIKFINMGKLSFQMLVICSCPFCELGAEEVFSMQDLHLGGNFVVNFFFETGSCDVA